MSGMSDEYKKEMERRGEKLFKTIFGNKQPMTYQEALDRGYLDVEPHSQSGSVNENENGRGAE